MNPYAIYVFDGGQRVFLVLNLHQCVLFQSFSVEIENIHKNNNNK